MQIDFVVYECELSDGRAGRKCTGWLLKSTNVIATAKLDLAVFISFYFIHLTVLQRNDKPRLHFELTLMR